MVDSKKTKLLVGIVMGSRSDEELMQPALDMLSELGVDYEVAVISAHRKPETVREYGQKARKRGIKVIIAGAGLAAHLPGVLASWTTIPVIGVPLPAGELKGMDALLSITQMPPGIPVACVGIGGAKNAALLAAQMLGLKYPKIAEACEEHRKRLATG
jgi:5-(carboxyamino)imidazole ribonucleotide mutase